MRTICVVNQKGGCGKTTTAVNLAAALAASRRVLLIDLDPQAHATLGLGLDPEKVERSAYDLLCRGAAVGQLRQAVAPNLHLVASQLFLAAAEPELSGRQGAEGRLREALTGVRDDYDYCLIDCPPNLGILTFNALRAAGRALVPVDPSVFSLHGLGKLRQTVELLRRNFGQYIELRALITNYDERTRFARQMLERVAAHFGRDLCRTRIRACIRVREAAALGQPLTVHASECTAAQDYYSLAIELIALERKGVRLASFFLEAPAAERVRLVGDFCQWRLDAAVEMARDAQGRWLAETKLPPGSYQYKFLVDNAWQPDPHNRCRESDPFGGVNSLLVVEE